MKHLSEGNQGEEAAKATGDEEAGYPAESWLLDAPRHISRRVHSGRLVRPLVEAQNEGPEPCTGGGASAAAHSNLTRHDTWPKCDDATRIQARASQAKRAELSCQGCLGTYRRAPASSTRRRRW